MGGWVSSAVFSHPVTLTNLHPLGSQQRHCYNPAAQGSRGEERGAQKGPVVE